MKFLTVCATLCALTIAGVTQSPSTSPTDLPTDDYAIYSAVLDAVFADSQYEHLVIEDQTMMHLPPIMMGMSSFGDPLGKIRQTIAKATLDGYNRKNKTAVALKNNFSSRVPVVLISASEREKVFDIKSEGERECANADGMKELQRLYPKSHGFMNISRIGFNKDSTQALVYIGNVCGGLCGSGRFVMLAKEKEGWKIKLSSTAWVS